MIDVVNIILIKFNNVSQLIEDFTIVQQLYNTAQ